MLGTLNLRGYTLALYTILHTVDASAIDLTATSIPNYVLDYGMLNPPKNISDKN